MWCKHTNFEIDTHVPMIISAPGKMASGGRTSALTEFVDIYPTLCELAGLKLPSHLEGTSMAPLLGNPDLPWKKAAFSQYPRGRTMGYSMRTDRYRYTEWRGLKTKALTARELYDLQTDPRSNLNVATLQENEPVVKKLAQLLEDGYRGARP
jgi:iduronate 2-sulfatase